MFFGFLKCEVLIFVKHTMKNALNNIFENFLKEKSRKIWIFTTIEVILPLF